VNVPTSPIALALTPENGQTAFEPGARLAGIASWKASVPPRGIELRLSWVSRGKGGRDLKIVETLGLPEPLAEERRPFILTLPRAPYSFSGHLISLGWTLELVASPGEEKTSVAIVIAPGRSTIELGRAPVR
jgi:hypothetical protein